VWFFGLPLKPKWMIKDADVFNQAPCAGRTRDYRASYFRGIRPGGDQRIATLIIVRIAVSSAK
jgi:hypothetical protein